MKPIIKIDPHVSLKRLDVRAIGAVVDAVTEYGNDRYLDGVSDVTGLIRAIGGPVAVEVARQLDALVAERRK